MVSEQKKRLPAAKKTQGSLRRRLRSARGGRRVSRSAGGNFLSLAFLVLLGVFMVLPLVYNNLCQGIAAADPKLLEMAKVFELSGWKTFRCCYLPAILPFFLSAVSSALGLAWKSGIAAEVLGRPLTAIGTKIYESKVYLETADLFAWTLVIILLSVALERLLLWVTDRVQKRRKGGERDAAV